MPSEYIKYEFGIQSIDAFDLILFQTNKGSPLAVTPEAGNSSLVGLFSFSGGCGDPALPGVYVNITTYVPWIQNRTSIPIESTTTTTETAETTETEETEQTSEPTVTVEPTESDQF